MEENPAPRGEILYPSLGMGEASIDTWCIFKYRYKVSQWPYCKKLRLSGFFGKKQLTIGIFWRNPLFPGKDGRLSRFFMEKLLAIGISQSKIS